MKWIPGIFAVAALSIGALHSASALTVDEKVIVAEQLIHPVRVGAGGLSATQRVDRINERINRIIATESLAPSNIHLGRVGREPAIFVGHKLVTTVTDADARVNGSTPELLAGRWLREYRRVLPQARPNANHR